MIFMKCQIIGWHMSGYQEFDGIHEVFVHTWEED